ncbi:uncharacterized protein LOC126613724 [Malus sylvestris]|uniref:uncharacterized protein LOC126613724 n=1 Tax=Malus sylvestris TaxID=3752 RepID=UPI0021ABB202|nr:uncharacterized protein LOC126613724 [Malus sylvestris]
MERSGSRSFTLSWWPFILAFLVLCFCSETCNAKDDSTKSSCTSSCGLIHNITYPFRLNDDPKRCGDRRYTLSCENNNITVLDQHYYGKYYVKYYVKAINYKNKTIRLLDHGLDNKNCSSMPRNFPPSTFSQIYGSLDPTTGSPFSTSVFYLSCRNPVNSSLYVDTAPCLNNSATSLIQPKSYSYVMVDRGLSMDDLNEGCGVEGMTLIQLGYSNGSYTNDSYSYEFIHSAVMNGFELRVYWPDELISPCNGSYYIYSSTHPKCFPRTIPEWQQLEFYFLTVVMLMLFYSFTVGFFQYAWAQIRHTLSGTADLGYFPRWFPFHSIVHGWEILMGIGLFFPARLLFGIPIAAVFLVYKWRRRHLSMYSTIEDFLQRDKNFMPIRYSYSDIKKMTRKFKDKLGEGGYGSVFKGKLRSGRFVAIKILGKSKANGQDFISEIATIGRIHHVNVVRLVGYCVEGSKRALVYEFMANGSLDKYIYSKEGSIPLTINKMYEISLGVAQGIEYLHQGCAMQILHFDIKPHNILLDENFKAKVSDFGLAKLYPVDNSIVTLTAARGTMGYIAPELFYKNIGGISHKADVYSFGMLLMEMASRRKNLNTTVEHSSQIYFPLWVYDQYNVGNDLEMDNVTEVEKNVIRKMVITALWCIQMKPTDRPSMHKVIEMLGGDVECLQMPPRPSLCPQETPVAVGDIQDPICSNVELTCSLSASLDMNTLKVESLLGMFTIRLHDDNFVKWSFQFRSVLEGYDLFDHFDGTSVCPPKFVFTEANGIITEITAAYKEWIKQDRALDRYATVSRARVNHLKTELLTIKKGSDSVEKYMLRLKALKDQLMAAGEVVSENDLIVAALAGLPAEFNMIRTVIVARETPISLKDFRAQLLAAERATEDSQSTLHFPMSAMYCQGESSNAHSSQDQRASQYFSSGYGFVTDATNSSQSTAHRPTGGIVSQASLPHFHQQGNGNFQNNRGYQHNGGNNGRFNNRSRYNGNNNGRFSGNSNGFPRGSNSNGFSGGSNSNGFPGGSNSNGFSGSSKGGSNWQNWNGNSGFKPTLIPECQICHKRGHTTTNCYSRYDASSSSVPPILECQICGKKGHSALNCYRRGNYAYQGAQPPSSFNAFTAQAQPNLPSSSQQNWVLDTGVTHHMTADLDHLTLITPFEGTDRITVGNGEGLPVANTGLGSLLTSSKPLTLQMVLHVPQLAVSLLSVYRLCKDNHCYVILDEFGFWVQDKATKKILLRGRSSSSGLYYIPQQQFFNYSQLVNNTPQALLGQLVKTSIWHQRLGHPTNEVRLKMLKESQISVSLDKSPQLCSACIRGKMTRQPFPSKCNKSSVPFEKVHTDVWGPSPTVSLEGYRYYVIFVDECTRFTWIFPLVNKSDVYTVFVKFHAFVMNHFKCSIKTLQSDGG